MVTIAFRAIGVSLNWVGEGKNEVAYDKKAQKIRVKIDPARYRAKDVPYLRCSSLKLRTELGWKPKISFEEMIDEMVRKDIEDQRKECQDASWCNSAL